MNMMQADIQWFIARDGKQHGPVSDTEMHKLVELGHLRPTDLVWRHGFADWRPAVSVFPPPEAAPISQPAASLAPPPEAVSAPQPFAPSPTLQPTTLAPLGRPAQSAPPARRQADPRPAPQPQTQHHQQPASARPAPRGETLQPFDLDDTTSSRGRGRARTAAIVLGALTVLGLGAGLIYMMRGTPPRGTSSSTTTQESAAGTPAQAPPAPGPASDVNPALDARLQKVAIWQRLKGEYPAWYDARLKEALSLSGEGKSAEDIDKHLVGEIVKLRRQHSKDALNASSAHLKTVAGAFLDNLKALHANSVPACYAFISRGEVIGVAVEMLHSADKGQAINGQLLAIFDAIASGKKSPTKHEAPQKTDYDVLAAELGKLGWTQGDMQLFADPRALARARPERVCLMVQDWFKAHLNVADGAVQERLLFETLKPVVSG